jgi:hypothetical protein
MAISVRCGCGLMVTADDAHAGQNVSCPSCQRAVPVPVAVARRELPPPNCPGANREQAVLAIVAVIVFLVLFGGFIATLEGPLPKYVAFACGLGVIKALHSLTSGRPM